MKDYQLENHTRYSCQFCSYATFSEKAFTSHSFLAHSEENSLTYKCRLCCTQFKTQIQANRHRKTKEHKRKFLMKTEACEKISCNFCDKTFDEIKTLEEHMWEIHLEQTSQCGFCGLRFAFPQELSAHIRLYCPTKCGEKVEVVKAGKRVTGSISCDSANKGKGVQKTRKNCDFTCDNITMLYYHQMLIHSNYLSTSPPESTLEKKFRCLVCKKEISRGKLWQHLSTHGDIADVNKRKCGQCFKIFPTLSHLLAHKRRTNHTLSKKTQKMSRSERHNQTPERRQRPSQPCLENGKLERLFKCTFSGCHYSTSKSSHLKIHLMVHDKNSKNRLSCSLCDVFSCKRKSELNRHLKARHPQEYHQSDKPSTTYERVTDDKFSCDKCSYSSISRQHYSRHLLTHIPRSKQLHKCKFCQFSCATVENLRKHILKTNTHPGSRVYSCTQTNCKFSTDESNEYKNHLVSQHRNAFKSLKEIRTSIREYFLVKSTDAT